MELQWRKCAADTWCPFATIVLPDANAAGVLLIWSESAQRVVFIGQGGFAKTLKWTRQFEPISGQRDLLVTWANVPEDRQGGVRNYLLERLPPVHSDRPHGRCADPDKPSVGIEVVGRTAVKEGCTR